MTVVDKELKDDPKSPKPELHYFVIMYISDLFPPGSVTPMLMAAKKCFHTAAYGAWDSCKYWKY